MELDCYAALSVCSTTETTRMDDADQSSSLVGKEATASTRISSTTISKNISKIRSRLSTLIGGPRKESHRQTRRQLLSHLDCYELFSLRTTSKNLAKPLEYIPRIAHPSLMTQN
jgi:hypothetical protein